MEKNRLAQLPEQATEMMAWTWERIEPYYRELAGRRLAPENVATFLADWSRLSDRLGEVYSRLNVAKDLHTADKEAEQRYVSFLENIFPRAQEAEQKLKSLLLASGLKPADFDLPLLRMQTEAALFRTENLPLMVEQQKLVTEYYKITGSQTVQWEGKELTVAQLRPVLQEQDRSRREKAWRLSTARQLADREKINELWKRFLNLRLQLAKNAGLADYRAFRWKEMLRFDYTPENCRQFRDAIAEAVVPAASRIYERRRKRLGLENLRPWDLNVDPLQRPALKPFAEVGQLESGVEMVLTRVDPALGSYFRTMRAEGLLDLENRKNKAPGAYCTSFDAAKRPFILMNAVGLHQDVTTLLHESGHACHSFESNHLPYFQQRQVGLEFAEVASMSMELLAAPYLTRDQGGFYTEPEARQAREDHLEGLVLFWPYMAVVDAFQHWVYENPGQSAEAPDCDRAWTALWDLFMPGVSWQGLETEKATGWHRKLHIHVEPFYYVEYGLAQLGACQVWANALKDQKNAVAAYRRALALGGTVRLPGLFQAAGARFAFDAETLGSVVRLIEETLG